MAIHNTIIKGGGDEESAGGMEQVFAMFGPGHVDQQVRQAVQSCWMSLPKERRTVEEVETTIRRIVERALASFREDAATFGKSVQGQ